MKWYNNVQIRHNVIHRLHLLETTSDQTLCEEKIWERLQEGYVHDYAIFFVTVWIINLI